MKYPSGMPNKLGMPRHPLYDNVCLKMDVKQDVQATGKVRQGTMLPVIMRAKRLAKNSIPLRSRTQS